MTAAAHSEWVLILDYGSQYTQLIARRIRECRVYCEIHPASGYDVASAAHHPPIGVVLSGGPESVTARGAPRLPAGLFDLDVPILGICYGMQALAHHFGGMVEGSRLREFGHAEVRVIASHPLLQDLGDPHGRLAVWMSHGDKVSELPEGFVRLAQSSNAPNAAIAHSELPIIGLQFHPEVTHTPQGQEILRRFVRDLCGAAGHWTPGNIVADSIASIRAAVGADRVLLALSGGVDSSVLAALVHRAVGEQLTCVFVDTGLLRLHEADQVMAALTEELGVRVIRVDAAERFLTALAGVEDPERKRKIIGAAFIDVFEAEAAKLDDVTWLAQGTIYPDVIESAGQAGGGAHVIKSHHNVGGLPERMKLSLLEPLRDLFKDEVRRAGEELGLSSALLYRHPFPGPGLGVRVLGEVKPAYVELLRQADAIYLEELRAADLYHDVAQAFAVFLPVKSVGVMGDGRRYDYVIALRAVQTTDFMTARWAHLPYEFLERVASRIINEVDGISRVTYDISSKPPATIEWE